ncbi:MAG TPA: hypothetical protein VEY50_04320 [Lysobacter sp.]|nr:hypothetical protein [Lysobacter sp.]
MSPVDPDTHPDAATLLDYWFGDTDAAATEAVDAHLMHCDACGAEVDALAALTRAVRGAFAAGALGAVVAADFVARLAARGLRVREYRVPRDGSVFCTVAPDDDVLVSRLEAPLHGVRRLDVVEEAPHGARRREDVPFDPERGEVVLAVRLALVRALPEHALRLRLLAVDEDGSREIGHYTFHHTPWR